MRILAPFLILFIAIASFGDDSTQKICPDLKKTMQLLSDELVQMEQVHIAVGNEDCCSASNLEALKNKVLQPLDSLMLARDYTQEVDTTISVGHNAAKFSKTFLTQIRNWSEAEEAVVGGAAAVAVAEGETAAKEIFANLKFLRIAGAAVFVVGALDVAILTIDGIQRLSSGEKYVAFKDELPQSITASMVQLRNGITKVGGLIKKYDCDVYGFDSKSPATASEHLGRSRADNALARSKALKKHMHGNVISLIFSHGDVCKRFGDVEAPWEIRTACRESVDTLRTVSEKFSGLSNDSKATSDLIKKEKEDIRQHCELSACEKCILRPYEEMREKYEKPGRTLDFLDRLKHERRELAKKCSETYGKSRTERMKEEKYQNETVVCDVHAGCDFEPDPEADKKLMETLFHSRPEDLEKNRELLRQHDFSVYVSVRGLKRKDCPALIHREGFRGVSMNELNNKFRVNPKVVTPVWDACFEKGQKLGRKMRDVFYMEAANRTATHEESIDPPVVSNPRYPQISCECGTVCAAEDYGFPDFVSYQKVSVSERFPMEACDKRGNGYLERYNKESFCRPGFKAKDVISCRLTASNDPQLGSCAKYSDGETVSLDWQLSLWMSYQAKHNKEVVDACAREGKRVSFCENRHEAFRVELEGKKYTTTRWVCWNSDGTFDVRAGGPVNNPWSPAIPGKDLIVKEFSPKNSGSASESEPRNPNH